MEKPEKKASLNSHKKLIGELKQLRQDLEQMWEGEGKGKEKEENSVLKQKLDLLTNHIKSIEEIISEDGLESIQSSADQSCNVIVGGVKIQKRITGKLLDDLSKSKTVPKDFNKRLGVLEEKIEKLSSELETALNGNAEAKWYSTDAAKLTFGVLGALLAAATAFGSALANAKSLNDAAAGSKADDAEALTAAAEATANATKATTAADKAQSKAEEAEMAAAIAKAAANLAAAKDAEAKAQAAAKEAQSASKEATEAATQAKEASGRLIEMAKSNPTAAAAAAKAESDSTEADKAAKVAAQAAEEADKAAKDAAKYAADKAPARANLLVTNNAVSSTTAPLLSTTTFFSHAAIDKAELNENDSREIELEKLYEAREYIFMSQRLISSKKVDQNTVWGGIVYYLENHTTTTDELHRALMLIKIASLSHDETYSFLWTDPLDIQDLSNQLYEAYKKSKKISDVFLEATTLKYNDEQIPFYHMGSLLQISLELINYDLTHVPTSDGSSNDMKQPSPVPRLV